MKKVLLVMAIVSSGYINAQAFKGKGDIKVQVGAGFQNHATGIVATADFGIAENLSYGFSAGYLLGVEDAGGVKPDFGDRADVKARFNANIGNVLNISEKFDLYPGLDLGLRNFGGHLGARYFFSNGFGVYTEAGIPIAKYDTDAEGFDELNNQFVFQIGASFNL